MTMMPETRSGTFNAARRATMPPVEESAPDRAVYVLGLEACDEVVYEVGEVERAAGRPGLAVATPVNRDDPKLALERVDLRPPHLGIHEEAGAKDDCWAGAGHLVVDIGPGSFNGRHYPPPLGAWDRTGDRFNRGRQNASGTVLYSMVNAVRIPSA
jgi:hypothetical protein